jgi:hypothetical protein
MEVRVCQCRLLISEHVPVAVAEIIREYTVSMPNSIIGPGYILDGINSDFYILELNFGFGSLQQMFWLLHSVRY